MKTLRDIPWGFKDGGADLTLDELKAMIEENNRLPNIVASVIIGRAREAQEKLRYEN